MVEEVVVQAAESVPVGLTQIAERVGVLAVDARMVVVRLVGVFDKQYVGCHLHQHISQGTGRYGGLYLPLRVAFGFQMEKFLLPFR